MKKLNDGELYQHLGDFLKARGILLKKGAYTKRIEQSCTLLSDAINLSQSSLERAKTKAGQQIDGLRQVIHEKTAPTPPAAQPAPATPPPTAAPSKPTPKVASRKTSARRTVKKKRAR